VLALQLHLLRYIRAAAITTTATATDTAAATDATAAD
jgi:hypothetical protein